MTASKSVSGESKREQFFEAAQEAMVAFELKEREFRKRIKQEDADELKLPLQPDGLHS